MNANDAILPRRGRGRARRPAPRPHARDPRPARQPAELQELAGRGRLPHDPEQPGCRGGRAPAGPGGLRGHRPRRARLGLLRPDPVVAPGAGGRRNPADPVRQAGGRVQDARERAARAAGQLQPCAEVGHLGTLQRTGPQGPVHVRPDDGRQLDLHRQPGHRAGHVRDLRRSRPPALRQRPLRQVDPHGGIGGMGGAQPWPPRWPAPCRSISSASKAASTFACARAMWTSRRATSTMRWS